MPSNKEEILKQEKEILRILNNETKRGNFWAPDWIANRIYYLRDDSWIYPILDCLVKRKLIERHSVGWYRIIIKGKEA